MIPAELDSGTLRTLIDEAQCHEDRARDRDEKTNTREWKQSKLWLQAKLDALPKETPAPAIPPDLAEALREWRKRNGGDLVADSTGPTVNQVLAAAIDAARERGEL